jgi:hypothetical protein
MKPTIQKFNPLTVQKKNLIRLIIRTHPANMHNVRNLLKMTICQLESLLNVLLN